MTAFLEGMNAGDLARAARTLDLTGLPALGREAQDELLAYRLWAILNRTEFVRPETLPDRPDGPPYVYRIYRDREGREVGRIEIARSAGSEEWRFSARTVASLGAIWELVRERPPIAGLELRAARALPPDEYVRRLVAPSMRERFGGLERWQWVGLGVLLLGSFVTGLAIRLGASVAVAVWRRRGRDSSVDAAAARGRVRSMVRATSWLAFAIVLRVGLPYLGLPAALAGALRAVVILAVGLASLWVLFAAWELALDAIGRRAGQISEKSEKLIIPFIRNVGRVVLGVGVGVWVLASFGVNVVGLVAGLGIGGAILALAAKDSVENVFGSLTVMLESPFQIGDWVIVGEVEGVVEEISIRSTRLRTFSDSLVTIPNSRLVTATIENMGRRRVRRFRTTLGLVYSTPPDKVLAFVERVWQHLREHPNIADEQSQVRFFDYGPSSLNILLHTFIRAEDWDEELRVRQEILLDVWRIAHDVGVQFAFPTQTMILAEAKSAFGGSTSS